ncbi:MAG: DUF255 domain-containing protein [Rhodobacteraceae bacterium]|nr:DUF255 domain-containing protein [Paracoccaceae bacterium]
MRHILSVVLILIASQSIAENRLAGISSPYLQQHADNPVDWYPWGPEALEKARAEDKLIFVSVGYSSCHWCHVMEEESFENQEIADYLNQHFVSIKIDRERRPDLDEQFILVTSTLTGSSGWPNSVFMTPAGDPFHAGTYFPPDHFLNLLGEITDIWQNENVALRLEAAGIAGKLRNYLDQKAVLGTVTSARINAAATAMLGDIDVFNGGFGTSPKFPNENVLLFLLDQAERSGDVTLLEAVTLTLDGMIKGGIHDHLGGGFHRYATDPEWNIPHFEKMLYNQALIGRVLLRGYSATGRADYARAATRVFDYVLRDMTDPGGGFYAAEDADSLDAAGARVEGAFYVWSPQEIHKILGGGDGGGADVVIDAFNVVEDGVFEGENILHLAELPGKVDIADEDLERLRLARLDRPAPIKDKKVILAWNAEMIATLAEASKVLQRPDYGVAAVRAARFLTTQMWLEAGLKRIWYLGEPDIEAQLTDYAAFGRALLALDDYLGPGDWLAQADLLAVKMIRLFGDPQKAMRMNVQAAGLGPFRPLDDNEVASGNAQALELLTGLDRRQARTSEAATDLAAALAVGAVKSPGQRAATLVALELLRNGLTGAMRVSDGGAARVFARVDRTAGRIELEVALRDGWHINAHEPLEDYLIGMEMAVNDVAVGKGIYPTPEVRRLGFSAQPLSLYKGGFVLSAPIDMADAPMVISLTLQACNDKVCLPPDEMLFRVW